MSTVYPTFEAISDAATNLAESFLKDAIHTTHSEMIYGVVPEPDEKPIYYVTPEFIACLKSDLARLPVPPVNSPDDLLILGEYWFFNAKCHPLANMVASYYFPTGGLHIYAPCPRCSGSGEGDHDGALCGACGGSGEAK